MTHSIAEAARRTGLSIDTLRYYERIGLTDPPARTSAGRRSYSDHDLEWLEFLTKLRTTGMPIRMMRNYTQLCRDGVGTAARRRELLIEHRAAVRERIAELTACLDLLDYKIDNYAKLAGQTADNPQEVPA